VASSFREAGPSQEEAGSSQGEAESSQGAGPSSSQVEDPCQVEEGSSREEAATHQRLQVLDSYKIVVVHCMEGAVAAAGVVGEAEDLTYLAILSSTLRVLKGDSLLQIRSSRLNAYVWTTTQCPTVSEKRPILTYFVQDSFLVQPRLDLQRRLQFRENADILSQLGLARS